MAVVADSACGSKQGWCKPSCPPPFIVCPQEPVIRFNPTFDGCCIAPTTVRPAPDYSFLCCGDQRHDETPDIHRTCTGGRCGEGICPCKRGDKPDKGHGCSSCGGKKVSADAGERTPELGRLPEEMAAF